MTPQIQAAEPPPLVAAPPGGAAPPGAPPGGPPFHSALAEHQARTAQAEGREGEGAREGGAETQSDAPSAAHQVVKHARAGAPTVQADALAAALLAPAASLAVLVGRLPVARGQQVSSSEASADAHVSAASDTATTGSVGSGREIAQAVTPAVRSNASQGEGKEIDVLPAGEANEPHASAAGAEIPSASAEDGTPQPGAAAPQPGAAAPQPGAAAHEPGSQRLTAGADPRANDATAQPKIAPSVAAAGAVHGGQVRHIGVAPGALASVEPIATQSADGASPVAPPSAAGRQTPPAPRPETLPAPANLGTSPASRQRETSPGSAAPKSDAPAQPSTPIRETPAAGASGHALPAAVRASAPGTAHVETAAPAEHGAPALATAAGGEASSASGSPAPSDARVDMQRMIESLQATIETAARQGLTRARIALHPAELGEIRIHLSQTSAGLLARLTAQTPAGAQALAAGRTELHQSLSSLGTHLLRLDIGSPGQPQDGGRQGRAATGGPGAPARGSGSATPEEETTSGAHHPDGETNRTRPAGALVDVLA